MKKKNILLSSLILLLIVSCAELEQLSKEFGTSSPTSAEIAKGLKEALIVGSKHAAAVSSKEGGFYTNDLIRIDLPDEVKPVTNKLEDIGLSSIVDDFRNNLNRGAELASKEAADVFVGAIKQMTITDAIGILKGDKNAATDYLKRTTTQELYTKFNPIVTRSLDKVEIAKHWTPVISTYNAIPFIKKREIDPDLNAYVTNQAIDGLFTLVAQEEAKIRENPAARVTDLLKRVFALQDKPASTTTP